MSLAGRFCCAGRTGLNILSMLVYMLGDLVGDTLLRHCWRNSDGGSYWVTSQLPLGEKRGARAGRNAGVGDW